MATPALVQALPLGVALVTACVPEGVPVEATLDPDSPWRLPLVVVNTSGPASVSHGPNEASADFTLAVRCYAVDRQAALDLCTSVYVGMHRLWRTRHVTPYGWITRISATSLQPQLIQSDLEADNVARFDCVLHIIARAMAPHPF